MNEAKLAQVKPQQTVVCLVRVEDPEAEVDKDVEFCAIQATPGWLWHAINHNTRALLAYVLAPHHDEAFLKLKALL